VVDLPPVEVDKKDADRLERKIDKLASDFRGFEGKVIDRLARLETVVYKNGNGEFCEIDKKTNKEKLKTKDILDKKEKNDEVKYNENSHVQFTGFLIDVVKLLLAVLLGILGYTSLIT